MTADRSLVRAWVVAVRDLESRTAALEIIQEAGRAEKTAEIDPKYFGAVITACQRLLGKTDLPPVNKGGIAVPYNDFPLRLLAANVVEIEVQPDGSGHRIWINVDGKCLLRVENTSNFVYSRKDEEESI